jgi:hypothetical protein
MHQQSELSSPFATLTPEDVDQILSSSPSLGIALHNFERDQSIQYAPIHSSLSPISPLCSLIGVRFCPKHSVLDAASQSTWRLHAALVSQMLQPLVNAYDRARAVASAALCSSAADELELAYRGDARSAFVWLHCLLAEEREWCAADGCPSTPFPPFLLLLLPSFSSYQAARRSLIGASDD